MRLGEGALPSERRIEEIAWTTRRCTTRDLVSSSSLKGAVLCALDCVAGVGSLVPQEQLSILP